MILLLTINVCLLTFGIVCLGLRIHRLTSEIDDLKTLIEQKRSQL